MAKKKAGSVSIGLILTLIFFIVATFVCGFLAYTGYSEQQQFKDEADKAKKEKATMEAKWREERVRKIMNRIAMGIEAPNKVEREDEKDSDRYILVSEMEAFRPAIKDEFDRIKRTVDDKLPDKDAFQWKLMDMKSKDLKDKTDTNYDVAAAATDPDVAPVKTLPQMLQKYKEDKEKARLAEKAAKIDAETAKQALAMKTDNSTNVLKIFNDGLDKLQAELKKKYADMDVDFQALRTKHMNDAAVAIAKADALGKDVNLKVEEIAKLNEKIKEQSQKIEKLESTGGGGGGGAAVVGGGMGASGGRTSAVGGVDFVNLEEKKGEIVRKEGNGFVTVNIGSSKKLKPQITFLVIRNDVSWLALLEKEESLKRNSARLDRQPFEDNPYVKAGIEITEITGAESARAKVIFENDPIRNPIQPRDQIFNLAWQPNEEIRIAFAGIIDLDGDGLDNNEDFLRILERQGVVVDEYLKLKPLENVKRDGKGMTLQTKYLVIAPDPRLDDVPIGKNSPQAEQIQKAMNAMSEMKARAKDLGIQLIEARKFLAMVGYKLPRNPVPPAYGAAVYIDQAAPPPMADPKKN